MKGSELAASSREWCAQLRHGSGKGVLGLLRNRMPDHLYVLAKGRKIYTSPWLREKPIRRCTGSICISLSGRPIEITTAKGIERHSAYAIAPMVHRAVHANDVGIVSFQFEPTHPWFRRFGRIASPGILPLERDLFAPFEAQLQAAYRGELAAPQAADLFEVVAQLLHQRLPRARAIDSRVAKMLDLLRVQHNCSLSELAEQVGVSYFRLSHLFAASMGMSLRSYQQWLKIRSAMALSKNDSTLASLAKASGFANAAHFTRAFAQFHAAPPSYFFQSGNVKIITASASY